MFLGSLFFSFLNYDIEVILGHRHITSVLVGYRSVVTTRQ